MQIQNSFKSASSPKFNGIHIANATNCIKNAETNIGLYQITSNDRPFLQKLRNTIKMNELMPDAKITKSEFDRWQEMLNVALDKALNSDRKCFIAAKDNKPCGIITFQPGKNKYHLDCICTWPVETGKKVVLAGQTLFKQMFTDFLGSKANMLSLDAILNGPFDTVSKYSRLGFKQVGGENWLVAMRTNRDTTEKTMKHLNNIINTNPTNNDTDLNLLETLDL